MSNERISLGSLVGTNLVEEFESFDMTEAQDVLKALAHTEAIDQAHAELLQMQSLYAAERLIEHIAKLVKTTSYLESKISSVKNKAALDYKAPDGGKTTADQKKYAGESHPEVEALSIQLAKTKGAKVLLERKYEILIKSHHQFKDISAGLRKSIVGNTNASNSEKETTVGW
jgi:hypothetical protein